MLAVNHHAVREGFGQQAAGLLDQALGGTDLGKLIRTGQIHGTGNGAAVLEAGLTQTHLNAVSVAEAEGSKLLVLHGLHLLGLAVLTEHGHGLVVGAQGKAAGIAQQVGHGFAFLQFKEHRALDHTLHLHHFLIGAHQHHVAFFQAHIGILGALLHIFVYVHGGYGLVAAHHLDLTQGTGFHHATGTVHGVEGRCKAGEHIGAGVLNVSHHVDLDGADLAQAQAHIRSGFSAETAVDGGQALLKVAVGLVHGFTAQVQGTQIRVADAAFRGDGAAEGGLVAAEDVDDHFISGAQPVVAGRGHILAGSEGHRAAAEDIAAVHLHLLLLGFGLSLGLRELGLVGLILQEFAVAFCIHAVLTSLVQDGRLGFGLVLALLVQLVHALGLLFGYAAETQLGGEFLLRLTLRQSLLYVFQYLGVGHRALCKGNAPHKEKAGTKGRYTSSEL